MVAKPLSKDMVFAEIGKIVDAVKNYGVRRIGVFGSVVRDCAGEESDLDLIVEFSEKTFDNYFDLKFFLENVFGRKVDLVIAETIKPHLKPRILAEVEYVPGF
ncbi:nucleotidyltransferase family protein [Desulfofundulus thermosubterraneus]|nr:nucleotidyltransferase family protein [Desulfofundulus thermosubterraneus]